MSYPLTGVILDILPPTEGRFPKIGFGTSRLGGDWGISTVVQSTSRPKVLCVSVYFLIDSSIVVFTGKTGPRVRYLYPTCFPPES